MDPIVIITIADLVELLTPVLPNLIVRENPDGEIVIFTGKQTASSDGHLAPVNRGDNGLHLRESELLAAAASLLHDFAPHSEAWNNERLNLLAKVFLENGRKAAIRRNDNGPQSAS